MQRRSYYVKDPILLMKKLLQRLGNFHLTYEEDSEGNCVPIITLEVLSDSSNAESYTLPTDNINELQTNNDYAQQNAGVHFLSEKTQDEVKTDFIDNRLTQEQVNAKEPSKVKIESGEYMMRSDGSVICKLCGEILQSRTHWYRHKYKLHAPQSLNPAPLFQCEQCLVFFKSRKGYIGHLASRHSEVLSDTSPVLTNAQVEAMAKEQQLQQQQQQQLQLHQQFQQFQQDYKDETEPELTITKCGMVNCHASAVKQTSAKPPDPKKLNKKVSTSTDTSISCQEWDEKRIREEKLVSDIIDRVRRECEAQGSGGSSRRGYSRRTTVMHT